MGYLGVRGLRSNKKEKTPSNVDHKHAFQILRNIINSEYFFSAYSTSLYLSVFPEKQNFVNKDVLHVRKARKFSQIPSENSK